MKQYKTAENVRKKALAYYYAHKEEVRAAQETRRREQGIPPKKPAMTVEEKLAVELRCKECGGLVTAPSLKLARRHHCTKCIKRRDRKRGIAVRSQRRWRASKTGKMQKFKAWKATQKCVKCGYAKDPQKLHFHHRNPATKIAKVSRMLHAYSMKLVWAEVAKCDLLCKRCHEETHAGPTY